MDELDPLLRRADTATRIPTAMRVRLVTAAAAALAARCRRRRLCLAAAVLTVGAGLALLLAVLSDRSAPAGPAEIAAAEAAMHRQQHPLAVESPRLADVVAGMPRLGFAARLPQRALPPATLLGGHYCSLAGGLALRLRLRGDDGAAYTLCMTRASATLPSDHWQRLDGLEIRIWREDDLVYAWTQAAAPVTAAR